MTIKTLRADRHWLRAPAAAALGVLHAASYAPPFGAWWLQLLALTGLLLLVRPRADGRSCPGTFASVFCFGIGWFVAGLSWLHTSMHVYGGMPSALAAAAVVLFALYLSAQPVIAIVFARRWPASRSENSAAALHPARERAAWALSLGGAWAFSEMLRGWLFTGFPWLSIGYAHVDGPLAGYAPWIGVYGVGAAAALICALLATVIDAALAARSRRAAGIANPPVAGNAPGATGALAVRGTLAELAMLVAAVALLGAGAALGRIELTQPDGALVTVRLLQGDVPQELKFDRQRALRAMDDYTRLIESSSARLIVLPETAWTVPWYATPPEITERIRAHAMRTGASIAIGMPLVEGEARASSTSRWTNSVALLEPSADAPASTIPIRARYDKQHLVPFGEFIPPGFGWFVALMRIPLGDFGRGGFAQAPFAVGGQRFAFNVCYEDLFGELLNASIRAPLAASVLVNVSNIAWFGDSHALPQHLAISRMRSMETGRPMLRATNTGVTASIDHRGRVLAVLPVHRQGALDTTVQGTSGITPYVRFGNLMPAAAAALLLAAAWIIAGRHGRRRR